MFAPGVGQGQPQLSLSSTSGQPQFNPRLIPSQPQVHFKALACLNDPVFLGGLGYLGQSGIWAISWVKFEYFLTQPQVDLS